MKFRKMHLYSKWTFQYFCGGQWIYTFTNRDYSFKRCYFKILLSLKWTLLPKQQIVSLWFSAVIIIFFSDTVAANFYWIYIFSNHKNIVICYMSVGRTLHTEGLSGKEQLILICIFFLIVVDLQCCASFRGTEQWFGFIYIYV